MGMFSTSTTLWHNTPSTQRQSLAGLSTHRQSILVLSAQQQYWDCSTAHRWVSCYSSDKVCNIFYFGPLCWNLTFRTTKGHSSYWGGDCDQVGCPVTSSLMMWLALTVATPGAVIIPTANGPRGASGTSSGNWPLRQAVTSRKPGAGVPCWTTSNSCVGEGASVGAIFVCQLWSAISR